MRKVRTQTARQNLDMAFHLAEKEFGVTRLLDSEGLLCLISYRYGTEKRKVPPPFKKWFRNVLAPVQLSARTSKVFHVPPFKPLIDPRPQTNK